MELQDRITGCNEVTRKEQIEALGKAWEALGNGGNVVVSTLGWQVWFYRSLKDRSDENPIARFTDFRNDTSDATPCLAILRDVKGEDWTINQSKLQGDICWFAMPIDSDIWDETTIVSEVSRIHAVTLAIGATE